MHRTIHGKPMKGNDAAGWKDQGILKASGSALENSVYDLAASALVRRHRGEYLGVPGEAQHRLVKHVLEHKVLVVVAGGQLHVLRK